MTLLPADAGQRRHDPREVDNAVRWIVRAGAPWRLVPNDFPRWEIVYQQTQRRLRAGGCEALVHDLRMLLRALAGRHPPPSAAILDGGALPSTRERGGVGRAGYDGHKRRKGSKVHLAVDTLGRSPARPRRPPANEQERAQVERLAVAVREAMGDHVERAYVDQGYTGEQPERDAAATGIRLEVAKLPEARRGCVLLPKRGVVERGFAWTARFRRLARDDERLPATLAGLHFVAFVCLMLPRLFHFFSRPNTL